MSPFVYFCFKGTLWDTNVTEGGKKNEGRTSADPAPSHVLNEFGRKMLNIKDALTDSSGEEEEYQDNYSNVVIRCFTDKT